MRMPLGTLRVAPGSMSTRPGLPMKRSELTVLFAATVAVAPPTLMLSVAAQRFVFAELL
jgi:hypothetical protein